MFKALRPVLRAIRRRKERERLDAKDNSQGDSDEKVGDAEDEHASTSNYVSENTYGDTYSLANFPHAMDEPFGVRWDAPRSPLVDASLGGLTVMWSVIAGATHSVVVVQQVTGRKLVFAIDGRHAEPRPANQPVLAVLAPTGRLEIDLPRKHSYVAYVACRDTFGQWSPFSQASSPAKLMTYEYFMVRTSELWTRKQHTQRMQTYICVDHLPVTIYKSPSLGPQQDLPVVPPLSQLHGFDSTTAGWLQVGPEAFVEQRSFRQEKSGERVRVHVPPVVPGNIPIDVEILVDGPSSLKDRLLQLYSNKCAVKMLVAAEKQIKLVARQEAKRASFEQVEWLTQQLEGVRQKVGTKDLQLAEVEERRFTGRTWKVPLKNKGINLRFGAQWDLRLSKLGRKVLEQVSIPSLLADWNEEQRKMQTNLHLKRGDELIAINGKPTGQLLLRLDKELKRSKVVLTFFRPALRARVGLTRGCCGNSTIELALDACGQPTGMLIDWTIVPPRILMVTAHSDAEKAGIEPDDAIQKVQGVQVTYDNIDEVTLNLRTRPLTLLIEKYVHSANNPLKMILQKEPTQEVYDIDVEEPGNVGLRLDFSVAPPVVLYTLHRTPAEKAFAFRGDRLLTINGKYVMGMEGTLIEHEFQKRPLKLRMLKGASVERDMHVERQLEEHKAAVALQSFWRFKAALRLVQNIRKHVAARKIQTRFRGNKGRAYVEVCKAEREALLRNRAAATIQARRRGQESRKSHPGVGVALRERRTERQEEKHRAATTIQKRWREKHNEFDIKQQMTADRRNSAARSIQARYRGRNTRRRVTHHEFVYKVTLGRAAPSYLWGIIWDPLSLEIKNTYRVKRVLNKSPASVWNDSCTDAKRVICAGDILIVEQSDALHGEEEGEGEGSRRLSVTLMFAANPVRTLKYFKNLAAQAASDDEDEEESSESEDDYGQSFVVVLTRLQLEEKWGLAFDDTSRTVVDLAPGTPVDRWNDDQRRVNSGCDIRIGTSILTVNGKLWDDWMRSEKNDSNFQLLIEAAHPKKVTLSGEIQIGLVCFEREQDETWDNLCISKEGFVTSIPENGIIWRWNQTQLLLTGEEGEESQKTAVDVRVGDRLATILWEKVTASCFPSHVTAIYLNLARSVLRDDARRKTKAPVGEDGTFEVMLVRRNAEPWGLHFNENTGEMRKVPKGSTLDHWNLLQTMQDSHAEIHVGDTLLSINGVLISDPAVHNELSANRLTLVFQPVTDDSVEAQDSDSRRDGRDSEDSGMAEQVVTLCREKGEKWGFALDEASFKVVSVTDGSIAQSGGVKVGQYVTRINGYAVSDTALEDLVGDVVILRLWRPSPPSEESSGVETVDLTPLVADEGFAITEDDEPERPRMQGKMYFVDLEELRSIGGTGPMGVVLENSVVQSIAANSPMEQWNSRQGANTNRVMIGDSLLSLENTKLRDLIGDQGETMSSTLERYAVRANFLTFFRPAPAASTIFSMTLKRESPGIPWGFLWDNAFLGTTGIRVLRDVKEGSIAALHNASAITPVVRGDVLVSVNGDKTCAKIGDGTKAAFSFLRAASRGHEKR
eukprot:GEMP01001676.1.p1 GENE.GEMP01001676.1~~GEMP01001676.1.p1  ORF type:complete len:1561 (+),score=373.33 GEMP01001676.1:174-4856(+)